MPNCLLTQCNDQHWLQYELIGKVELGKGIHKVCDAEVFDAVITDWDCVEDQIAALEDKGIQVIVVDEPDE